LPFYNIEMWKPDASKCTRARELTLCFQRLVQLDNDAFERLGRRESAIAPQVLKKAAFAGPNKTIA
jgi:hypothetical protein